jgi:pilus assembly protein CpaC
MEEQISNGFTDLTEDLYRNSKKAEPPLPERGLDPESYSHN